jgi:uracil phosphoribosyltransferase
LPKGIKDNDVILTDATIGTGASALMAIRILLDHEVPEVVQDVVHVSKKKKILI